MTPFYNAAAFLQNQSNPLLLAYQNAELFRRGAAGVNRPLFPPCGQDACADGSVASQDGDKDDQWSATYPGLAYQALIENFRNGSQLLQGHELAANGMMNSKQVKSTVSTKAAGSTHELARGDSSPSDNRGNVFTAVDPPSSNVTSVAESNPSPSETRVNESRKIHVPASEAGTLTSLPKVGKSIERKRVNNAHTRLCRKRVNDKFQELLSVLPPVENSEHMLRHKSQILDYCIRKVCELKSRNVELEEKLNAAISILDICVKQGGSEEKVQSCSKAVKPLMDLLHLGKKD